MTRPKSEQPHPPNRLRELRLARNMTLEQVGNALGHSGETIRKLEQGERGLDIRWMEKLAGVLEVQPWELIAGAPDLGAEEHALLSLFTKLGEDGRAEIWSAIRREARYHGISLDDLSSEKQQP